MRSDAARPGSDFLVEHRTFVVRLCRILLRDADEAEDAAQQVLLNAHRAVGSGVRPLNVRAWLARIARNECRSRVRRLATHPEAELRETSSTGGLDPADAADQRALIGRLRQELAALPDRQREALLLREFRGLSYAEVAAALDETGPAVESLLQRARRRLVARLGEARRPFVGATLLLDWIRNAVSRIVPGPAATEAAATGGAAAVVAKLAAAGVVAVGAAVAGGDVNVTRQAAPVPAAAHELAASRSSVGTRPVDRPSIAVASESRRGRATGEDSRRGPESTRRGEEARGGSGPGEAPSVTAGEDTEPSAPSPSGPGPTPSEPAGSSSGESGSSSSGPGDGSQTMSSSDSSGHSGSGGSGSSGSGSGETAPTGSDSGGSGSLTSGSSGSGSDSTSDPSGSGSSGSDD